MTMRSTTYAEAKSAIRDARNLEDLRDALVSAAALDEGDQADLAAGLPTFGGDNPGYDATFSWDDDRVLQYDDAIGWVITPRD
jgi:hypothetical protein